MQEMVNLKDGRVGLTRDQKTYGTGVMVQDGKKTERVQKKVDGTVKWVEVPVMVEQQKSVHTNKIMVAIQYKDVYGKLVLADFQPMAKDKIFKKEAA